MGVRRALAMACLGAALACGGGGGGSVDSTYTPPPTPPSNTVWVGGTGAYGSTGMTFSPAVLTVPAGTTVTFSWKSGTHTVTSYAYNGSPTFPGLPMPGQSTGDYTYQFNTPGTYYYYCEYHGTLAAGGTSLATGMVGSVVVQ
ncbi:MAG TPA: hypothetical protein VJ623_10795 [Holophagaceae bacterium]|nr:hypothetical protein [Holophagaceae bacterium]